MSICMQDDLSSGALSAQAQAVIRQSPTRNTRLRVVLVLSAGVALLGVVSGPTTGITPHASAVPLRDARVEQVVLDAIAAAAVSPQPVTEPAAAPMPTIMPPPRPATVDARVPSTVLSSLGSVPKDLPRPYFDGCHVQVGGVMPSKSCLYGT